MGERHPIQVAPHVPLEERVRLLEAHLAQLWDQVWWGGLPAADRARYEAEGFRAPIERFYVEG